MDEFSVSVATISNWVRQFRDECQINEKANKSIEEKENIKNKIKETHHSNNGS